jgi:hypothetical protein
VAFSDRGATLQLKLRAREVQLFNVWKPPGRDVNGESERDASVGRFCVPRRASKVPLRIRALWICLVILSTASRGKLELSFNR